MLAPTPEPPYYAVIFSSLRTPEDGVGYAATAQQMLELAAEQPGFLGMESARSELGLTVSYWGSLEAIRQWRDVAEHRLARAQGHKRRYQAFQVRIARVEREYGWSRPGRGSDGAMTPADV